MITLTPTHPVHQNWNISREPRAGILLHYDDSGSDTGALDWLTKDPRCAVSYHILILRTGLAYEIVPLAQRAWHAGVCEPSDPTHLPYRDANAVFYGVAIAANDHEVATPAQQAAVLEVCQLLAARHGWDLAAEPWRISGHNREAWPRGRKSDPESAVPHHIVLSVAAVRDALSPPPSPVA